MLLPMLALIGCSASRPAVSAPTQGNTPAGAASAAAPRAIHAAPAPAPVYPVMLGIDVLESQGFALLRGKRVALLTHPAGVNRRGVSTIDVLRHAPGVQLVALFGGEHGVYGEFHASINYPDHIDPRTGLPVFSLYTGLADKGGHMHRPTRAQLKGIDVFVVDLQDNGTRSYTFISAMKTAMEGCFENGVEFVVLDRPNPLSGLKVDGPLLDPNLVSYVGEFRVPYVYGLTIGELAHMAKEAPGVLDVPEAVREAGKLAVVPMQGWRRGMRWPETGLTWVPTSTHMPDFPAVEGYPMTGLGTQPPSPFVSGVENEYLFRCISCKGVKLETIEKDLRALQLPGVDFRRASVPNPKTGKPAICLFIEITDWDAWNPVQLNFDLMKLACKYDPRNPFALATRTPAGMKEMHLFLNLMGSTAFYNDLIAHGARVDVDGYLRDWRAKDEVYRQLSRRYWIYF
jgi:uncharacterized protein YbbC (DUF1343 family)